MDIGEVKGVLLHRGLNDVLPVLSLFVVSKMGQIQ
jgi:hypothetical protein